VHEEHPQDLVLIAGATGFVGKRLLRELQSAGRSVRCFVRRPEKLAGLIYGKTQVARGDLLDPGSLEAALRGVRTAFYLVHSMDDKGDFESLDRKAARQFGEAARRAGVRRIVYLGGLGEEGSDLSAHLRSRHEVGVLLGECGVEVIELRASIVLGCGSVSFEMIRALVERLPVMITPRWVDTPSQPIGIDDLIRCLVSAVDLPPGRGRVIEIGGADCFSYGEIMREYARQRGLRRLMISVPVLTPRLSSLWLGLVTPFYATVGRKLVDSLRNPTVVREASGMESLGVHPVGVREAITATLLEEDMEFRSSRWAVLADSRPGRPGLSLAPRPWLVDARSLDVKAPAKRVFAAIERLGGANGWYYANWLWRLRGALDSAIGGVGLRRGRSDPRRMRVGDQVDFWRIEELDPGHRLRLAAEMKVPGRAWLEFEVTGGEDGTRIRQTAVFEPHGLAGVLYWRALTFVHLLVFRGLLRGIAREANRETPHPVSSLASGGV
jgi:uncharacterized protein YbjT (DUF2867 family)